jgi:nitrite reductase/ring-hydroxylating ferredoxin subunit
MDKSTDPSPAAEPKSQTVRENWREIGPYETLYQKGVITGHGVVVFLHNGGIHAVDNRCPHMGFPLSKGTVHNGILTCHWHSWQFDLAGGGCLSPTEADVAVYPVKVDKGTVMVNLTPFPKETVIQRHRNKLDAALRVNSSLEASKAAYRLLKEGAEIQSLAARGVDLAIRFQDKFSSGMAALSAVGRVLTRFQINFPLEARTLGLVQALAMVSGEAQGAPARRVRHSLPGAQASLDKLKEWFRGFLEDREVFGAERILRTAMAAGAGREQVADFLFAAATDHVFIGEGHVLDFTNKALELLDMAGWDQAPDLLTSLLSDISSSQRHEEEMAWKHPKDLIYLIHEAEKEIPTDILSPSSSRAPGDPWERGEFLAGAEPEEAFAFLVKALREGAGLESAAMALAAAALLRMHRFHTRNEFFDWDTVHHLFTHANSLVRAVQRAPSPELARGLFHAYGYLYLTRFLNIPSARMPEEGEDRREGVSEEGLSSAIENRRLEEAAAQVYGLIQGGRPVAEVERVLALSAFREDHGFHTWQQLEASFSLYELLPAGPKRYRPLSSLARWLAAHSPTPRSRAQTVDNAIRLERGDKLYED